MRSKPHREQQPSSVRKRREAHRAFMNGVRYHKRRRSERARIHGAMEAASRLAALSRRGPFRAGERTDAGWPILDHDGVELGVFESREKLRAAVRYRNDLGALSLDEAMLTLGWRRVERSSRSDHVELKYVRA